MKQRNAEQKLGIDNKYIEKRKIIDTFTIPYSYRLLQANRTERKREYTKTSLAEKIYINSDT